LQFRSRGSRRKSAVAQLFSLGIAATVLFFYRPRKFSTTFLTPMKDATLCRLFAKRPFVVAAVVAFCFMRSVYVSFGFHFI
jgi:hypothetical protein